MFYVGINENQRKRSENSFDLQIYNELPHDLLLLSDRQLRQNLIFTDMTWINVSWKTFVFIR